MDILLFSKEIQKRIESMKDSTTHDLVDTGKLLSEIRRILTELKQSVTTYSFTTEQEEIKFFKEIKPALLCEYYYHKQVFEILLFDSFRDESSRIENYHARLRKAEHFAYKNRELYEYCISGAAFLDSQYFTRKKGTHLPIDTDENFSTGYDKKVGKLLANDRIKKFVLEAIHKTENSISSGQSISLQWTTSKVALIELIYALYATGVFNYGKIEVKQIVTLFEKMFSVELGNYARVFSEIRIRKSGQVNFLAQLKDRLIEFTSDADARN